MVVEDDETDDGRLIADGLKYADAETICRLVNESNAVKSYGEHLTCKPIPT